MECKRKENLKERCSCTYPGCDRKGLCCDCLDYHLAKKQLPGCCFPPQAEKAYDRGFAAFARAWGLGGGK